MKAGTHQGVRGRTYNGAKPPDTQKLSSAIRKEIRGSHNGQEMKEKERKKKKKRNERKTDNKILRQKETKRNKNKTTKRK